MNFPDASLPPLVIVDDSQDDAFLLRYRLRHGEIANPVSSFECPQDALSYLRAAYVVGALPQIVLVDIKMPGGFDFVSSIREDSRFEEVKVVAITYSNAPADLKHALDLGVDGYVLKFPDPDILADFLQHGPWFSVNRHPAKAAHALCA